MRSFLYDASETLDDLRAKLVLEGPPSVAPGFIVPPESNVPPEAASEEVELRRKSIRLMVTYKSFNMGISGL